MIRILHIELDYRIGGIEIFLKNITEKKPMDLQFDFVCTSTKQPLLDYFRERGSNIYFVPSVKQIYKYCKTLNKIIENGKYDIVHIHKNSCANIIPFFICKKNKVRSVICHSHNTSSNYGKRGNILHMFNRLFIKRLCDKQLACSEKASEWMFGQKSASTIFYNPIDLNTFSYSSEARKRWRERLHIGLDKKVILHIGRYDKQKNHKFLLEVFRKICIKSDDYVLIAIGKGELENQIKDRADSYGLLNKIVFIEQLDNKSVSEIMSASDYFLFPSLYEGLGIVLIEAQATGLKVITSDKVPLETSVSNNIMYLSLKDDKEWVDCLLNIRDSKNDDYRKDRSEEIMKYDLIKSEFILHDIYLECIKNNL